MCHVLVLRIGFAPGITPRALQSLDPPGAEFRQQMGTRYRG